MSYLDLLHGRTVLSEHVRPGTWVRFDSPGEDLDTERALIARDGGRAGDLAAGELAPLRAWYAGFRETLLDLDAQLVGCAPHVRMQRTDHLLTMWRVGSAAYAGQLHLRGALGLPGRIPAHPGAARPPPPAVRGRVRRQRQHGPPDLHLRGGYPAGGPRRARLLDGVRGRGRVFQWPQRPGADPPCPVP
ncbi:hypothetical protein [Deinococcus sp. Leaf326]|uniref:hypothetical protein n=1 Tax=Deinococcus sp. Leaf326 TaxID=1736338 RepID=UPI0012E2A665|nr:hypothetical protein [Deinococcus sp. Leaf326]